MNDVEPMLDSSDLLSDPQALRRRAEEDGYLFFRGLLDRDKVFDVRRRMVEVLVRHGYVDASDGVGKERVIHEAVAAQPRDQVIEQCMTMQLYTDIQKLEAFHALPHDPALMAAYGALFGEPALPHPRHIARIIMPGETFFPTPPHQDFPLVQGAVETWTGWIPLGEAPLSMGPLSLMPGSHKGGVLDTFVAPGAGATGAKISHLPPRWVSADFAAGDVLAFSSLTVHRALPQQNRDLVRLSMDVRYQPASKPIQALSLRPHTASYVAFGGDKRPLPDWEEIYAGWSSDALKYYWRKYDLEHTSFEQQHLPFLRELQPKRWKRVSKRLDDRRGL